MPWLPLLEEGNRESWRDLATTRIAFLEKFDAKFGSAAGTERTRSGRIPVSRTEALIRAAEFALTSDQTDFAIRLLGRAFEALIRSDAREPLLQISLIGALLGRVQTYLDPEGIRLQFESRAPFAHYESAIHLDRVAGSLVSAALASQPGPGVLSLLRNVPQQPPPAWVVVTNTLEAETLPLFGIGRDLTGKIEREPDGLSRLAGIGAFIALHQRYAGQLRAVREEPEAFGQISPSAPLIDWSLLTLHLALVRGERERPTEGRMSSSYFSEWGPIGRLARFLREIAEMFDRASR